MATQNTATRFANLVHRSISDPVSRAIQADALATEIADRRSWINNTGHGHLFATLQVVLADEFVLSLTRMFDEPHRKHPTQSIPAILQFMDSKARWLPIHKRAPLEDLLVAAGAPLADIQKLGDADLTRRVAAHYRARLPNPDKWKSDQLSASLRALRFRRNKQIAHAQRVNHKNRVAAEWRDGRSLLQWALELGDVIGAGYLDFYFLASDGKTYLADRLAREAARDLSDVLDKTGLPRGRFRRGAA